MFQEKFDITIPDMHDELCQLLRQIPNGKVTTYGEMARALGSVSASRWIALHLNRNVDPDEFPLHRVVRSTGDLGTYRNGKVDLKRELLLHEKIKIQDGLINIERYLFNKFSSNEPLAKLKKQQDHIKDKIRIRPLKYLPDVVGAVDVSYSQDDKSYATYAVVDCKTQELIWSKTVSSPFSFPYIPGFLAYRELPVYLKLIKIVKKSGRLAPVTLVDGNGILHPQKAGIACQLGIYTGLKTIGVAKSLLCGKVIDSKIDQHHLIEYQDEITGVAVLPKGSKKPLYISPGNGVDLKNSLGIVRKLMTNHRLPEPVYHADRISRKEAGKASS